MRNLVFLSLLFLIILAGCNSPTKQPAEAKPSNGEAPSKKAAPAMLSLDDPIVLDSSGYVMFALPNKIDDENHSLISKSSGLGMTDWNIIFYNTESKKYHLLDERRKMVITGFGGPKASYGEIDGISNEPGGLNDLIFYFAITSDFNADGKLSREDPQYLFVSDKQGNNFRQISPDSLDVLSWKVIKKTGKLLIETMKDSNSDKKFKTEDDEVSPYIYDIKSGGIAQPVFNDEFKSHVNALFKKRWPKE